MAGELEHVEDDAGDVGAGPAGGAAEWLAASWEDWLNDRPVWLTEEWRLGIPGHFLPAAARVPLPLLPAAVAAAAAALKIAEFGAGRSGSV